MKRRNVSYSAFTDVGGRQLNEDSIGAYERQEGCCFILCDGLGGHGMGDMASQAVKEVFADMFQKQAELSSFLENAFPAAQDILTAEQARLNAGKMMKTTAVSLVIGRDHAYIGHVGDSRAYVFGKNRVLARTLDHSVPQMLALTGDIREEEIRFHRERNILLRVMGEKWEEPMQELMKPVPLRRCRAFLLCSDGFWELIGENEMCSLLQQTDCAKEWLDEMVQVVRKNGAGREMDNYSAIAVRLD